MAHLVTGWVPLMDSSLKDSVVVNATANASYEQVEVRTRQEGSRNSNVCNFGSYVVVCRVVVFGLRNILSTCSPCDASLSVLAPIRLCRISIKSLGALRYCTLTVFFLRSRGLSRGRPTTYE